MAGNVFYLLVFSFQQLKTSNLKQCKLNILLRLIRRSSRAHIAVERLLPVMYSEAKVCLTSHQMRLLNTEINYQQNAAVSSAILGTQV